MTYKSLAQYNYVNCPGSDKYKELVRQAKALYKGSQEHIKDSFSCMILAAQRLQIIRDKKLYKEGEYKTFGEFLEEEIELNRATVYKYMQFVKLFENELKVESDFLKLKPTTVFPALSFLSSDKLSEKLSEEAKKKIITDYYGFVKEPKMTQRKVLENVEDARIEYDIPKKEINRQKNNQINVNGLSEGIKGLLKVLCGSDENDFEEIKRIITTMTIASLKEALEAIPEKK